MANDSANILIKEFGEKKVKTSKDYLDKYGSDWYKGLQAQPCAITFPEN